MTVQQFLNELGGSTQVAKALGVPLTTVCAWGQRNRVPSWRLRELAALAVEKGKAVPAGFADIAA
jgi:DNA-binding transcriptional regulator YiaG